MKNTIKHVLILFAILFSSTAMITGCGDATSSVVPASMGNLEGFVYAKNYNEGALSRILVAGRTVPSGYLPVENASVSITGTSHTGSTDENGRFYITEIMTGSYTVAVSKNGESISFSVTIAGNATTIANDQVGDTALTIAPSSTGVLSVSASAQCVTTVPVTADVYILASGQSDYSDSSFNTPLALISDIAPGSYSVKVSSSDYSDSTPQSATVTAGNTTSLTFSLSPSAGNVAPVAQVSSPLANANYTQGNTIIFSGAGVDCEDGNLTGSSLVWSSSIDGQIGTGSPLTSSSLSAGSHTITLTVTDSGGRTHSDTVSITVDANTNTAPTANIVLPANNSSYNLNETVTFTGAGTDAEGAVSSLVWTSSIDGQIGTGAFIQKNNLSAGTHTITLTATDSGNLTGSTSISITVSATPSQNAPVAAITTPITGSSYSLNQTVTFSGAATDTEDGNLTGSSLTWTSSIDGQLGTGNLIQSNSLSAGSHTITLTARDSDNMTSEATVSITVSSTPATNANPTAAIGFPPSGSTYSAGTALLFIGGATDAEDVTLIGSSLVWTSSINGQIGTGASFNYSAFTAGSHTITLTATDSDGGVDTATISLTIN